MNPLSSLFAFLSVLTLCPQAKCHKCREVRLQLSFFHRRRTDANNRDTAPKFANWSGEKGAVGAYLKSCSAVVTCQTKAGGKAPTIRAAHSGFRELFFPAFGHPRAHVLDHGLGLIRGKIETGSASESIGGRGFPALRANTQHKSSFQTDLRLGYDIVERRHLPSNRKP